MAAAAAPSTKAADSELGDRWQHLSERTEAWMCLERDLEAFQKACTALASKFKAWKKLLRALRVASKADRRLPRSRVTLTRPTSSLAGPVVGGPAGAIAMRAWRPQTRGASAGYGNADLQHVWMERGDGMPACVFLSSVYPSFSPVRAQPAPRSLSTRPAPSGERRCVQLIAGHNDAALPANAAVLIISRARSA
ncbi:hypothetical protein C8R44DRAFT_745745 [Mycena epipterygia]|nr:hypothetical protein C8R44DRAFT_745745 [Mycena epipterygia]